jgi:16S rRNA (cytosine1402-N4)-methyltransferase
VDHIPVLLDEALGHLNIKPGGLYIDATLGAGGHAAEILRLSAPDGRLLGLDADPLAIETARANLLPYAGRFVLINDNFVRLKAIAVGQGFSAVRGILFDLGMSSLQLATERGFSFQGDAPLDMRFGPSSDRTAAELLASVSEAELTKLLFEYGEEPQARRIARAIVQRRAERPLERTGELAELVEKATGGRRGHLHPATRTFQALRIAVNRELEVLPGALKEAVDLLEPGGRLAVISFHSLEDRIAKRFFREESQGCICPRNIPVCVCQHRSSLALVTKKAVKPTEAEIKRNPRSRSARLRVAEKLPLDESDHGE